MSSGRMNTWRARAPQLTGAAGQLGLRGRFRAARTALAGSQAPSTWSPTTAGMKPAWDGAARCAQPRRATQPRRVAWRLAAAPSCLGRAPGGRSAISLSDSVRLCSAACGREASRSVSAPLTSAAHMRQLRSRHAAAATPCLRHLGCVGRAAVAHGCVLARRRPGGAFSGAGACGTSARPSGTAAPAGAAASTRGACVARAAARRRARRPRGPGRARQLCRSRRRFRLRRATALRRAAAFARQAHHGFAACGGAAVHEAEVQG